MIKQTTIHAGKRTEVQVLEVAQRANRTNASGLEQAHTVGFSAANVSCVNVRNIPLYAYLHTCISEQYTSQACK